MPYCTIEEAWKQSLNPEIEKDLNQKSSVDLGYSKINLEDSELYNSDGEPIRKKNRKKMKKNRVPNMSRTYNRLSEHNGPKTRLKSSGKKRLVRKNSQQILDNSENHPSYSNSDLPINSHNNSMYEELDNEYDKNSNIDKSSMMEDFRNIPNNKEMDLLKEENSRLKKIIEDLKNSNVEDKDTLIDLAVYISTGVIIILMLENITKLIRKF
tara:strand:- start:451 stop:1083 length:633 start_codon:yes stop_codon:yes gene_type:complete